MPKPTDPVYPSGDAECFEGINHRTWIAAQIMSGFAANPLPVRADQIKMVATLAVQWTDALIAELNKKRLSQPEEGN